MRDRHHLLFDRQEWSLRPEGILLRENPSLIITMDRGVHMELHRKCPSVPVLGRFALYRAARDFRPTDDKLESVDNLLFAIDKANKSPKSHSLERSLGELTMQAIEMQKPYLIEGMHR